MQPTNQLNINRQKIGYAFEAFHGRQPLLIVCVRIIF